MAIDPGRGDFHEIKIVDPEFRCSNIRRYDARRGETDAHR
jgi:hypothetical protein